MIVQYVQTKRCILYCIIVDNVTNVIWDGYVNDWAGHSMSLMVLQVFHLGCCIRCISPCRQSYLWRHPPHRSPTHSLLQPQPVQAQCPQPRPLLPVFQPVQRHPGLRRTFTSRLSFTDLLSVHRCCLLWGLSIRYTVNALPDLDCFIQMLLKLPLEQPWLYNSAALELWSDILFYFTAMRIGLCQKMTQLLFVIISPLNLIIFEFKMIKLCELHSLSTSSNLCQHADAFNCYVTWWLSLSDCSPFYY